MKHYSTPFLLVLGLTVSTLSACSGTDLSGANTKRAKASIDAGDGGDGDETDTDRASGQGNQDTDNGGDPNAGDTLGNSTVGIDGLDDIAGIDPALVEGGELIRCPKKPQKILILDFKSGWWAGDGGDFFNKLLGALHQDCPDDVSIEYHHITRGPGIIFVAKKVINMQMFVPNGAGNLALGSSDFSTAFGDASWESYTEVWVLSGSHADPLDLVPNDAFFNAVLGKLSAIKANVFIGAGYGSITHANSASSTLGLGTPFSTDQAEGRILDPMGGVRVTSSVKTGEQLAKHILFTRGADEVADAMEVGGKQAYGDILSGGSSVKLLGKDSRGKGTIAVGKSGTRRVVMDADLPRYYSIWKDESQGTLQLLKNVIVYLSR